VKLCNFIRSTSRSRKIRVGRKHEVTAIHKPTGISVMKDGISFQVTRKQCLETLENRVAEKNEKNEENEE
jgi:protein subunit release factor A